MEPINCRLICKISFSHVTLRDGTVLQISEDRQKKSIDVYKRQEKGYGFGAEGDWKVAAMVRLMKIMTAGKKDAKGT